MHVRRFLLAAGGAAVLAAGGCSAGSTTAAAPAAPTAAPLSASWNTTGPTAAPTVGAAQIAPGAYQPVPVATGLYQAAVPSLAATPAVTASIAPTAGCSPALGPATTIPVTATAGTGAITVRWTDLSDPAVLTYRLAAIPDYGAPTAWQTVSAGHSCKTLTTTITGLTKGKNYEIWLDAVHTGTSYGTNGVARETMIGRSAVVTVR